MAEFLDTKEDVAAHIAVALEENDIEFLFSIVNALARAEGMTAIARKLGVTREGLYQSLAPDGNPSFATVVRLLDLLGYRLSVKAKTRTQKAA